MTKQILFHPFSTVYLTQMVTTLAAAWMGGDNSDLQSATLADRTDRQLIVANPCTNDMLD